jgi:hypothetical protein
MPVVTAAYPQQVPTFTDKFDLVDVVFAEHINSLQREVAALATALGTLPAGAAATVRERMEAVEAAVADINSRFTATQTFPQTAVDGLPTALGNLQASIGSLQSSLAQVTGQVTALQSQKPEVAQVVQVTGFQYIYGLKAFQGLVRLLATQLYSAVSTNHAWEIGVSGGRVIKFDYTGFGAYDGSGPAEMVLQRDGGEVFYGGGVRAAGMVGIEVDDPTVRSTDSESYTTLSGAPSLTLRVPMSGRVNVHLFNEALAPSGGARVSVAVSGANTLNPADIRSTLVGTPYWHGAARTLYLTGLTPGSTVFTAQFLSIDGSTAQFRNVSLAVVPVL